MPTKFSLTAMIALLYFTMGIIFIQDTDNGAPEFPTLGGVGAVVGKVIAISPNLPSGTVAGDLLLMFLETANEVITVSGWTEMSCSPATRGATCPGDPQCTRLTIFYKTATGSDTTTTSDSGNHQIGRIIGINAGSWDTGDPFDGCVASSQALTTSVIMPAITTTNSNTLVFASSVGDGPDSLSTTEFSGEANANLASLTELIDNARNPGNGGALLVVDGTNATPDNIGTTTSTAVTQAARATITFAVNPVP